MYEQKRVEERKCKIAEVRVWSLKSEEANEVLHLCLRNLASSHYRRKYEGRGGPKETLILNI